MPKKAVTQKYVYGDILMNNRPNSIIFSHKTGALCWKVDTKLASFTRSSITYK